MAFFGAVSCASAAFADCVPMNGDLSASPDRSVEIRFSPEPIDRFHISLSRANEVAPFIRIGVYPEVTRLENKPFSSEGGTIFYLEPGPQGPRLCRVEEWKRRVQKVSSDDASSLPAIQRILPYFELRQVRTIHYDPSGLLVSSRKIDANARGSTIFCALYDKEGRIEVANESSETGVSGSPGFQCWQLRDGPVKKVTRYFAYRADGFLASDMTKTATRKPGEGAGQEDVGFGTEVTDGAWYAQGDFYFNDGNVHRRVGASFQMSDKRGLTGIQSESFAIASSDATPVFEQRSRDEGRELNYTFPGERVSPDVLKGQFDGVTAYTRVREYFHRTGQRIFEIFAPGAKHPRERQWRTLDLKRQENYDTSGKLTRVILSGPTPADAYTENLRAYAEKGVLKLTPLTSGYSSYRVYDYDATGKESLSFVCWRYEVSTNKPYAHFPWWESDPRPKRSREAELQYGRTQVGTRCGTPDGKMIVEGMGPVKKLMEAKYGFGTTKLGFPGE